MTVLRTPDGRFTQLSGYPFEPHYVQVSDQRLGPLRMHYFDEGDRQAPVVLLLHGEPTWSYLFRRSVPPLLDGGLRVVAPDLVGFGRSDKPAAQQDYSYAAHVGWLTQFCRSLKLHDAVVVGHDWGGLLGLRLVTELDGLAAGYVATNHGYPTGDLPANETLRTWQEFAASTPEFDTATIVASACAGDLDDGVRAAYDAPYPEEKFKAGARTFPALIPVTPDDPASAAVRTSREVLSRSRMPFLTVYGEQDPIAGAADAMFQQLVPGAAGQPHRRLPDAGHNMPEDAGPAFGRIIADFALSLPLRA
jgi:haloalkane dehalogenase